LKPLETVRSAIENGLKVKSGYEKALAAAADARSKIESGQSMENILGEGQVIEKQTGLTRTATNKVDPLVLDAIFNMPRPEVGEVVVREVSTYTGDVVLVKLDKVNLPETIEQSRIEAIKRQWRQNVALSEFDAALSHMRSSIDLYVNPRILQ
jgi:hypothetical protein